MIKITTYSLSEAGLESNDWRSAVTHKIEGVEDKPIFLVFFDGEPEDNSISRNFADVFAIPSLLERAIKKGKSISEIITIDIEVDSLDEMP